MKAWQLLVPCIAAFAGQETRAEAYLGIELAQGRNGRPVVTRVIEKIDNFRTLGSYLDLKEGDEIFTAYSDPIRLKDGNLADAWDINSIAELRWVLDNTRSRIGVTVRRGEEYIKTVLTFKELQDKRKNLDGSIQNLKLYAPSGAIDGPTRVKEP
jgi:hypothetical protein